MFVILSLIWCLPHIVMEVFRAQAIAHLMLAEGSFLSHDPIVSIGYRCDRSSRSLLGFGTVESMANVFGHCPGSVVTITLLSCGACLNSIRKKES